MFRADADLLAGGARRAPRSSASGVFTWTPTEVQGPGDYTFRVRVSDGALSDEGWLTLRVTEVNDVPAGTDKTVTTAEDTAYTFAAADFGFTDPNDIPANAFSRVQITTLPAAGTLKLSGTAVTAGDFITVADIPNLTFSRRPTQRQSVHDVHVPGGGRRRDGGRRREPDRAPTC